MSSTKRKTVADKLKQLQLLLIGILLASGIQQLIQALNEWHPLIIESSFFYSILLLAGGFVFWAVWSQSWATDDRLTEEIRLLKEETQSLRKELRSHPNEE